MAEPTPPSQPQGIKRPHSDSASEAHQQPHKRRKVRRSLRHVQRKPQPIEPAPQDPVFAQGQLLKSIGAALVMVGFDSVKPTALEMFRGCVEEYMLEFLSYVRTSTQNARRTSPTAQDFASALARMPNTSTASLLSPQLRFQLPEFVSYPAIPEPDPPPAPAPDFSVLLQPLVVIDTPSYIPAHFPQLPPQHAWMQTPVFPEREKDARKMREKATEEGILAEQALRKLAAAAKKGAVNAERRREGTLAGAGKMRDSALPRVLRKGRERGSSRGGGGGGGEEMFAEMLKDVDGGAEDEAAGLGSDGTAGMRSDGVGVGMPEGVVVNWDMAGWRRGGRRKQSWF